MMPLPDAGYRMPDKLLKELSNTKIKKLANRLFILFCFLLASGIRHPASGYAAGLSSGGVLMRAYGARSIGVAEALTGVPGDIGGISVLQYNPGAAGFIKGKEIYITGQKGMSDDTAGSFIMGIPRRYGTLSWSFLYYSAGNIDLINTQGITRNVTAEKDYVLSMSYGAVMDESYGVGVSLKYLRSQLIDDLSASAVAADAGFQLKNDQMTLGLSVQNAGTKLKYIETEENLPLTLRGGISYKYDFDNTARIMPSFDIIKERDSNLKELLGAEILWREAISLRAGYKFGQDGGKLNFGAGLNLGFQIDYAYSGGEDAGTSHTVSLGVKF